MKLEEIKESEIEKYFGERESFSDRTILARIINPLEFLGYKAIVHSFLRNELSYRIAVLDKSNKPLGYLKTDFNKIKEDEDKLLRKVVEKTNERQRRINHLYIDFRRVEDRWLFDETLKIYFTEEGKNLVISELNIPQVFAHNFTLEGNLKYKVNYLQIIAKYIPDYRKELSQSELFERNFIKAS